MEKLQLLHGSDHIIEKPDFLLGKEHNDYGRGFYCTKEYLMACEWACKQNTDGFVNRYSFDYYGLKVLNLLDGKHNILNWIALLLEHRTFRLDTDLGIEVRNYIIQNFSTDLSAYDVVIGYRADDSYFSFAESFVQNSLPLRSLSKALLLGRLGIQTAIVSEKAFERLTFLDAAVAEKTIYYPNFFKRDSSARAAYKNEIKTAASYRDDIFAMDILREEMKNDDARIQRIILE